MSQAIQYKIMKVPNERFLFRPVKIDGAVTTYLTYKPVPMIDAKRIIDSYKKVTK